MFFVCSVFACQSRNLPKTCTRTTSRGGDRNTTGESDDIHFYIFLIFTSYTMGFNEIPTDIRAIFWNLFCIPRAFRRVEYRKNTKKLREYHRYFLKTHGITVLSYNYLIFSHHKAFYRQLTGVKLKKIFFQMFVCTL